MCPGDGRRRSEAPSGFVPLQNSQSPRTLLPPNLKRAACDPGEPERRPPQRHERQQAVSTTTELREACATAFTTMQQCRPPRGPRGCRSPRRRLRLSSAVTGGESTARRSSHARIGGSIMPQEGISRIKTQLNTNTYTRYSVGCAAVWAVILAVGRRWIFETWKSLPAGVCRLVERVDVGDDRPGGLSRAKEAHAPGREGSRSCRSRWSRSASSASSACSLPARGPRGAERTFPHRGRPVQIRPVRGAGPCRSARRSGSKGVAEALAGNHFPWFHGSHGRVAGHKRRGRRVLLLAGGRLKQEPDPRGRCGD